MHPNAHVARPSNQSINQSINQYNQSSRQADKESISSTNKEHCLNTPTLLCLQSSPCKSWLGRQDKPGRGSLEGLVRKLVARIKTDTLEAILHGLARSVFNFVRVLRQLPINVCLRARSLSLSLVYCFGRHEPSNNFCPHGSGICSDAWQPNNTKTMASERLINCDIPAIVACSYSVRLHMRVDQKQAELPWV